MELLDIIATSLPLAGPAQSGDRTVVVQGGVLKAQAPVKVIDGAIGGSVIVIDTSAAGVIGSFLLNVSVASGCSIRIETSRNNGSTYQLLGGADWTTDVSVQYAKQAGDTSYVTHIRLTRVAGSATTSTYTVTNGYAAFTGAQNDMIGVMREKALVVGTLSGDPTTTRGKYADPANDRGWTLQSFGLDSNIVQINNHAITPWDYSRGSPFFMVERCSVAAVFVNPATTLTGQPPTNRGTVANAAALVTLTTAVVQDYATATSPSGLVHVLVALPPTTAGNWVALPAGAPGAVTIYNPRALELNENGGELRWKSRSANVWIVG